MQRLLVLVLLALAAFAVWTSLRARRAPPGSLTGEAAPALERPAAPPVETILARERAAAHFERGELDLARAELAALIAQHDAPSAPLSGPARAAALEDLVRAAAVEHLDRAGGAPEALFERIRALDPAHPALHYMLARRSLEQGDFEAAREHFQTVLRTRPEDLATRVGLAATLSDLGRAEEARPLFEAVLAQGVEQAGLWYVQAVYRLWQEAERAGPPEDALSLGALFQQLTELGYRSATADELARGTLVGVGPSAPSGIEGALAGRLPRFVPEDAILPELAGARELFVHDLDGDGTSDFLAAGAQGVVCALRGAQGYRVETVLAGQVEHVRAFDLGNDDSLDLVVCLGAEVVLFEQRSGAELLLGGGGAPDAARAQSRWRRSPLVLPPLDAPPADLCLVDFDHEGDLDLLLVGGFGARLWRNDGAAARQEEHGNELRGAFVDATAEAGLPTAVELAWAAVEDFDGDQDVDLLLGGPGALFLMDSLRAGRFVDVAARVFGGEPRLAREPLVADLDADGRADLLEPGPAGQAAAPASRLWRQRADGSFQPEAAQPLAALPSALDLDLDGTLDLLVASERAAAVGWLGFGLPVERAVEIEGRAGIPASDPLVFRDLDGDLDVDLARVTQQGLEIWRCQGPVGNATRLELLGLKDNRRALGAVVEARTRGLYRRLWWSGEPELLGSGAHPSIDVLRTTWPNGVVQTRLDVPPGDQPFLDTESGGLEQSESLIGSCPFLYAWNGSTFGFVTDVLGGTPLGLPMGPGVLVPPDHDEFVLVRGEELVPRAGRLELQLTEELREVTYLDRVRLDVVDHPAGTAVYPNERFTFPPFPAPHVHTVRERLAARRATGSDGRDWSAELAAVDGVHAQPFEPLEPQLLGLATPHWLELDFEPERVRAAARLRLVCTGWFFWTDASVNMASARTPGVAFVPPTLEVQGSDGAWRAVGPPLGFPAGKSKTMVIELGDVLDRERPRLRLVSTLRLYWDALELALDADDAPLRITALEPQSALLWPRGFSSPGVPERSDQPERFDWDRLAERARWDQHPGRYTRYGETLPLLQSIDDRFVILGSGDALALSFDAAGAPPLPDGWVRDYLVFLDGWAKDRDPNTLAALAVEPLPFHAMSAYPYPPSESFPAGELHAAWRARWNTREHRRWIAPLAPAREAQWALELARGR